MSELCSISNVKSAEYCRDTYLPFPQIPKKKFTVTVEGNIGSGKSTFIKYFNDNPSVAMVPEPVNLWQDLRGYNLLDLMYRDKTRWSCTFQSYVQLTMLQGHLQKVTAPIKLMERSIYSARYCFAENLHNSKQMPGVDYAVLSEWFDWITTNATCNVDLIVYLRASPDTCMERLRGRNRLEETGVSMEDLESLHELHDDWLIHQRKYKAPAPVLVINADKDLPQLQRDIDDKRVEILCGYS